MPVFVSVDIPDYRTYFVGAKIRCRVSFARSLAEGTSLLNSADEPDKPGKASRSKSFAKIKSFANSSECTKTSDLRRAKGSVIPAEADMADMSRYTSRWDANERSWSWSIPPRSQSNGPKMSNVALMSKTDSSKFLRSSSNFGYALCLNSEQTGFKSSEFDELKFGGPLDTGSTYKPKNRTKEDKILVCYSQIIGVISANLNIVKKEVIDVLKVKFPRPLTSSGEVSGYGGGSLNVGFNSESKGMPLISSNNSVAFYCTPPSLISCDLELKQGENKKFEYVSRLPEILPPSIDGESLKITYFLSVGVEYYSAKIKSRNILLPFKVLKKPSSTCTDILNELLPQAKPEISYITSDQFEGSLLSEELDYINDTDVSDNEALDVKEVLSDGDTEWRGIPAEGDEEMMDLFAVNFHMEDLASLSLSSGFFYVGGSLSGAMCIKRNDCVKVTVFLECMENYDKDSQETFLKDKNWQVCKVHDSRCMYTQNIKTINFMIFLSSCASPTITTTSVNIEWRLRFRFELRAKSKSSPNNYKLQESITTIQDGFKQIFTKSPSRSSAQFQKEQMLKNNIKDLDLEPDKCFSIKVTSDHGHTETRECTVPITILGRIYTFTTDDTRTVCLT